MGKKRIVDEYKKIRHYFSCDFYNLGSSVFDDTSWAIWQYHDADSGKGIVMAFRRSNSPFESAKIKLKGTSVNKMYRFTNLDTGCSFDGNNSLEITLSEKRRSTIFEYEEK